MGKLNSPPTASPCALQNWTIIDSTTASWSDVDIEMATNVRTVLAPNQAAGWSPYEDNGGTVLAIRGDTFAVCAADTRLSGDWSLYTRNAQKWVQLTSKCVLASSGCQADIDTLHKLMLHKIALFKFSHGVEPSLDAVAHLLSVTLYGRRFFPFFALNILAGVNKEGKGETYHYDAIGTLGADDYGVAGSGRRIAEAILDARIRGNDADLAVPSKRLSVLELVECVKDVMHSIAERDIYTGDTIQVVVIDATAGVSVTSFPVRRD